MSARHPPSQSRCRSYNNINQEPLFPLRQDSLRRTLHIFRRLFEQSKDNCRLGSRVPCRGHRRKRDHQRDRPKARSRTVTMSMQMRRAKSTPEFRETTQTHSPRGSGTCSSTSAQPEYYGDSILELNPRCKAVQPGPSARSKISHMSLKLSR